MKTQIGGILGKWFEEFMSFLEASRTVGKPVNMVALINTSLSMLNNYLCTAMMILNSERRLPAKALLRVSGELISKVIWVLNGKDSDERQNRLERWIKTTYREANKYDKEIVEIYSNDKRSNVRNEIETRKKIIDVRTVEISDFEQRGIKSLPTASDIFIEAFGKSNLRAGMYSQYLHAVHPDLSVLTESVTESVSENQTLTTFGGDTKESIDRLKLDCLTQARIFLDEICKYYSGDFEKMVQEHRKQYYKVYADYSGTK